MPRTKCTKYRSAPSNIPPIETRLHELIGNRRWDEVRSYLKTPEGGAEAKRYHGLPLALALSRYYYYRPFVQTPADIIITLVRLDDESAKMVSVHMFAKYDKTGELVKAWLEAHPEDAKKREIVKFLELQRERGRERRKKEREERERQRMKERNDMEQKHKKQREELEREHKEERENIERKHKRQREEEREEERKDEREELEREHKRKRKEELEEREREHERKNDCPICLEALNAQECACTPCGHIFHRDCVGKSLRTGSAECPTCREKFRSLNLRTIYLP